MLEAYVCLFCSNVEQLVSIVTEIYIYIYVLNIQTLNPYAQIRWYFHLCSLLRMPLWNRIYNRQSKPGRPVCQLTKLHETFINLTSINRIQLPGFATIQQKVTPDEFWLHIVVWKRVYKPAVMIEKLISKQNHRMLWRFVNQLYIFISPFLVTMR